MKKIVIILLTVTLCTFSYLLGFFMNTNSLYEKVTQKDNPNETLTKDDYPLIEMSITSNDEWFVIIRSDLFSKDEKFAVCDDEECLSFNKENLVISTFPVGRGTTPNGVVYIYRNNELVKQIPFIEVRFENNIFKDEFENAKKEDIEKLINMSLPSPI